MMKRIRKFFLNRVPLEELEDMHIKFLLNKSNFDNLSENNLLILVNRFKKELIHLIEPEYLSEDYLSFLFKKFNKEIRDYYIKQDLPSFNIKQSDKKIMESLSSLYESSDYKNFVRLLCNKKDSVAKANLMKDPTPEKSNAYWKGYYRGQSKLISHILALVKYIHNQWIEIENKKWDK